LRVCGALSSAHGAIGDASDDAPTWRAVAGLGTAVWVVVAAWVRGRGRLFISEGTHGAIGDAGDDAPAVRAVRVIRAAIGVRVAATFGGSRLSGSTHGTLGNAGHDAPAVGAVRLVRAAVGVHVATREVRLGDRGILLRDTLGAVGNAGLLVGAADGAVRALGTAL